MIFLDYSNYPFKSDIITDLPGSERYGYYRLQSYNEFTSAKTSRYVALIYDRRTNLHRFVTTEAREYYKI